MTGAWAWLIGACALYLLVRMNLWFYSLPKEERDEATRDMNVW